MRAALYSRVSTTNGQNPEVQLRELREYCARRGWTPVGEYTDIGISGSKETTLRESGHFWPTIARELGVSVGTAFQAGQRLSTNLPKTPPANR